MADWMVERVAKAIKAKVPFGYGMTDDEAMEYAHAALREMRVPSNRMLNAAAAALSAGKRPTEQRVSNKAKHAIRYRAMIDAELRWYDRVGLPVSPIVTSAAERP